MVTIKSGGIVILADGNFPSHEISLTVLRNASHIICCDGAAKSLLKSGLEPFAIVGDCDSLNPEIFRKYSDRIFKDTEQETNDLTKAVRWCSERGYNDIVILGATGKREDHTVGNISLLTEYAQFINIKMITDTGIFYPVLKTSRFESSPGRQVSIFSINPETEITSSGLLYPLIKRKLKNWWEASLNEATGDHFELEFEGGAVIVFILF
jgi:thiamine pyrophosphokinase